MELSLRARVWRLLVGGIFKRNEWDEIKIKKLSESMMMMGDAVGVCAIVGWYDLHSY